MYVFIVMVNHFFTSFNRSLVLVLFADYGIISFPPSRVTPTGACQLVSQFGRFGRFGQMESLIWSSGKKSGKIVHQTALSVANSTVGRLNIFAVLVRPEKSTGKSYIRW